MSMSRKDFVAVAESVRMVRDEFGPDADAVLDRLVSHLCGDFARANQHFDRSRFIAACAPDRKDNP